MRPARCLTDISLATAWPVTRGVWVTKQPKANCQQGAASRAGPPGPPRPHLSPPQGDGSGAVSRPPAGAAKGAGGSVLSCLV